jgi:hypothetical protein
MKRSLLFMSMVIVVLTMPMLAIQQAAAPEPQGQNPPGPPDQSALRTFEGELSKVDSTAKTITVKATAPDREMVFTYDDQTQVAGTGDGIQGLTGKMGSALKVSYRSDQRGINYATKIEIQSKALD